MGTESESPEPDCQKQFQAAVNVIQNLPKNGSYRPSYEEMLRFYSYYKQATVGPCLVPRPGFWDPIGRYKWDAWNSLGKMSREEAMSAYITEMKLVAQKVGRGGCRPLSVPRLSARWPAPASSLTPIVFPAHRYPSGAVPPPLPVSGSCLGTRWRRATGQEQGGGGPAQGGRRTVVRGASLSPLTLLPTQVIDTVPLGEVAGDMFGYFEPLYQVIPDMPRPPETFLRRITGWKEQVLNGDAGAAPEPPRLPKEPAPPSPESQPPRDQDSEVFCDSLEQLEPELVWAEQGSAHGGELDARNSPEPPAGKGEPLLDLPPLPWGSSALGLPLAALLGRGESPALGTGGSSLCLGRVAKQPGTGPDGQSPCPASSPRPTRSPYPWQAAGVGVLAQLSPTPTWRHGLRRRSLSGPPVWDSQRTTLRCVLSLSRTSHVPCPIFSPCSSEGVAEREMTIFS
uniref:Acyl-CoA binding domain containing 4 n=1 Tax=Sus scrofa TaxID=9823 RepID=A0A8D0XH04_PIG